MSVENRELQEQYQQMVKLRNDSSLLKGFTFHTVAGDVTIKSNLKAILMLDCYIRELKDEIINEGS